VLRLLDERGSDALGARVKITCGERVIWRDCQAAYSYLASNDPRVHVGLGPADRADEVRVYWPGGGEQSFGPLEAGRLHVLRK
jgi:hypothetical protein